MAEEKNNGAVEEIVKDLMEDPDAPDKADTTPPQTIDAEPESGDRR